MLRGAEFGSRKSDILANQVDVSCAVSWNYRLDFKFKTGICYLFLSALHMLCLVLIFLGCLLISESFKASFGPAHLIIFLECCFAWKYPSVDAL